MTGLRRPSAGRCRCSEITFVRSVLQHKDSITHCSHRSSSRHSVNGAVFFFLVMGSYVVHAQTHLKLLWPSAPTPAVVVTESRALCTLGRHSTAAPHPSPLCYYYYSYFFTVWKHCLPSLMKQPLCTCFFLESLPPNCVSQACSSTLFVSFPRSIMIPFV